MKQLRKSLFLWLLIAALAIPAITTRSETASASPPTDNWYAKSHYGLFVHYTYGSSSFNQTIYPNGTVPLNLNALGSDFNATQFAADAASFGVDYVTFTAWHYAMNAIYPSAKMNQWRPGHATTRDVIQDLINALQPYGIKLVLYIHLTDGHDFTMADQTATGWNDSTNNYGTWNNFLNDVVTEMGNRYGTGVAGYWIDMVYDGPYQNKIDKARLRTSLLAGNPNRIIIGNGGNADSPNTMGGGSTDYLSREYFPYTRDINAWVTSTNQTAIPFSLGDWWATVPQGTNSLLYTPEQMFRFTVMQAGSNLNGGGMAWGAGPYAGNGALWEDGIKTGMQTVGGYINAIAPSLKNVYPSTSYITPAGRNLTNIYNGIVATQSTDGLYEYIHVLNPPSGKTLTLPAPSDGKLFGAASLTANGHSVALSQNSSGVTLTLGASDNWSTLDTAIRLTVTGTSNGTILNDSSSSISYNGTWGYSNNRNVGDYQNDVHHTSTNGDFFQYAFTGTGIDYVTSKDINYGNVDIYVDGVFKQTVSALNASGYVPQQTLYSIRGLASGSHTFKAVKTSGSYMQLDALRVYDEIQLNDTVSGITYSGTWGYSNNRNVGDYQNDVHYTTVNGDFFQYTFTGTGIDYITSKDINHRNVDIYIDGVFKQTVSALNASGYVPQQVLYGIRGLSSGSHTIKVVKTSGSYMQLDRLVIIP